MCIEVCELRLSRIVHFGGGDKRNKTEMGD
jgi:hypothetical protein